jgi:hypothetical protein
MWRASAVILALLGVTCWAGAAFGVWLLLHGDHAHSDNMATDMAEHREHKAILAGIAGGFLLGLAFFKGARQAYGDAREAPKARYELPPDDRYAAYIAKRNQRQD